MTDMPTGAFRDMPEPATEYAAETGSIANDFYNPYLEKASRYHRLTGYFSSTVYLLTWDAMRTFILDNDGAIRLVCSPKVMPADVEAIHEGEDQQTLEESLRSDLDDLLAGEETRAPTRLLAALVANDRLDLKVAVWQDDSGHEDIAMFHDKVGIFEDDQQNLITFRGSVNETFLGLSTRGNVESISVYPSWVGDRDATRARNAETRFERIFNNESPAIRVESLPEGVETDLVRIGAEIPLEQAFDEVDAAATREAFGTLPPLRDHQSDAIDAWADNGHVGIFEHATGAGKTISGLVVTALALDEGLVPVILVPSKELLKQWAGVVRQYLQAEPEMCGDVHTVWKTPGRLEYLLSPDNETPRPIIAILDTARSQLFKTAVANAERITLIVDEVHRIGSSENRTILDDVAAERRLGLSATPDRAGDPVGTAALYDYFDKVVDTYTLADGIRDGYLAHYTYEPRIVRLSDDEQEEWDELTRKISRAYARFGDTDTQPAFLDRMLQNRARIAKRAAAKTPEIVRTVQAHYRDGQKWLIYCADIEQLDGVRLSLADVGIASTAYHSKMKGDRSQTLRRFALKGGIVVAVKCLDEGVDIPGATHALIAASSRNPREFIQRRGRVLRTAPDKTSAMVVDILVAPQTHTPGQRPSLVLGEIARAAAFAESARNSYEARRPLLLLLQEFDAEDIEEIMKIGYEDDEQEPGDESE